MTLNICYLIQMTNGRSEKHIVLTTSSNYNQNLQKVGTECKIVTDLGLSPAAWKVVVLEKQVGMPSILVFPCGSWMSSEAWQGPSSFPFITLRFLSYLITCAQLHNYTHSKYWLIRQKYRLPTCLFVVFISVIACYLTKTQGRTTHYYIT